MAYPTFSYTTSEKLIAEVKLEAQVDTDIRIKRWVLEGSKEMMTLKEFVPKTATLQIADLSAELPCDFVRLLDENSIAFTTNGVANNSWLNTWSFIYVGGPFIQCNPFASYAINEYGTPVIQVIDGRLWFSSNCRQETECTIGYQAVLLDDSGVLKIPDINSRPIIAYATYKYMRATGKSRTIWQDYKDEWTNGKLHRRGIAAKPDPYEQAQIGRIMNRLL